MPDTKVLKESAIVESDGCYPARIIIRKQTNQAPVMLAWKKTDVLYCTHIEVRPPDREAFSVSGKYDMSLEDAEYNLTVRFEKLLDDGAQEVINERWGRPLHEEPLWYHSVNPDCLGHSEDG